MSAPKPTHRFTFDSTGAFGDAVEAVERANTRTPLANDVSRNKTPEDHWDLNLGLDEAITMATSGARWPEGARGMQPLDLTERVHASLDRPVPVLTTDVQGYSPIVPAYLSGVPECMLRIDTHTEPKQGLRIGLSFIHSCITTSKAILNRGRAMLSVVDALELAGYPIELWAVYRVRGGECTASIEVCIKRMGEHWDPANVAFQLCHPASGRRLGFRWLESREGCHDVARNNYGCGTPMDYSDFDVAFPYMDGDAGFETPDQALQTVADKTLGYIQMRDNPA